MLDKEAVEFQLDCNISDSNICNKCAFFINCERKYTLRQSIKEFCSLVSETIILFPSKDSWESFIYDNGFVALHEKTYEEIIKISNEFDLEIIVYN